jgi:hypothetical protein
MFKLFRKDNFLDDFWKNLQILKDLNSLNESKINILGKSGLLISAHKKNDFTRNIKVNMQSVLSEGDSSTGTSIELIEDSSDMYWLILKDIEEYDLLSSSYTTLNALYANDSLQNILALVFKFEFIIKNSEKVIIFLIYRIDLKSFYPFMPISQNPKSRNKEIEILFSNYLSKNKIKIETTQKNWLGVWGIPF